MPYYYEQKQGEYWKKSKGSKPVRVGYKEWMEKDIPLTKRSTTTYSFLECNPSITSKKIYDERIKLGGCKFSNNLWMFNGHGGGDDIYLDEVWKPGQKKLDYVNLNPGEQVLVVCTPGEPLFLHKWLSSSLSSHSVAQQYAARRGGSDEGLDVMGKSVMGAEGGAGAGWCPGPHMIWNWAIKNKSPAKLMSSLIRDQDKMFGHPSLCVFTKKVPNIDLYYRGGGENPELRQRAGLYKLPLSYEIRDPEQIEMYRIWRLEERQQAGENNTAGALAGWEDKMPMLERKWAPYSKKTQKDREAHDISFFSPGIKVTSPHYPEDPKLDFIKRNRLALKEIINMVRYNLDFEKEEEEGPIINRSFTLVIFACRGSVKTNYGELEDWKYPWL